MQNKFKVGDKVGWASSRTNGRYSTVRRTEGIIHEIEGNLAKVTITRMQEAIAKRNLYDIDITSPYITIRTTLLYKL